MDQWALVVGDTLLIVAVLVGGAVTLVRLGPASRGAGFLAGAGCVVLLLAGLFDLLWWLVIDPGTGDEAMANLGVLTHHVLLVAGVGLLFGAVHSGRVAARVTTAAHRHAIPESRTGAADGRYRAPDGRPATPDGRGRSPAGPRAGQPATGGAPSGGWTPPRQAAPADWSHMSGVWSIPRGAFDEPPQSPQSPT